MINASFSLMESAAVEHTSLVTKGRRTKRQRSAAAITSASSTRGGGGSDAVEGGGGVGFDNNHYSSSSTASASGNCNSDDQDIMSEITTEEEDMAHCLIMLARGNTTPNATIEKLPLPSKYECKTCNKIFPSFQALGGHRASHKKPKATLPESLSLSPSPSPGPSPDHNQQMKNNEGQTKVAVRVHECSICGSEFPSGQALGGHMRRHRAPPSASASGPSDRPIESGVRNVLPLDLNLPAPGDDDDKIEGGSSGQNIETTTFHRVLPTPALVDCHN
ncbi:hypothetical protein Cgig2_004342 [Carnegiea gigantea]|uniref:C2H2-type domain-containing protein n=1 Tax=Carnegiea gigantea TaxID=171969 RepID=A0A9Q1JF21_9CARY|nr:hypothetical protein Cgig2_004342 [Carnegiea gigantea]